MEFVFGLMGLAFGLIAYHRIDQLEKRLKETGLLDKDFDSEK